MPDSAFPSRTLARASRKILVLSPCDVFPPVHGSSTAIYHTLQFLSETNQVHALLCTLYSQHGEADLLGPTLTAPLLPRIAAGPAGIQGPDFQPPLLPGSLEIRPRLPAGRHPGRAPVDCAGGPLAAQATGVPVVLMQENVEYQKFVRFGMTSPLLKGVKWLEGWACRAADRVVALSEVDRDFMIDLYGVGPERFTLIPHGVDPDLFDYRPEGAAAARDKLGAGPRRAAPHLRGQAGLPTQRPCRGVHRREDCAGHLGAPPPGPIRHHRPGG